MTESLENLPASNDDFWQDAKKTSHTPKPIAICEEHYFEMEGSGTAVCMNCPQGIRLPGYMRVLDGKVVDLRVSAVKQ